jgi:hypothetical protein
MGPIWQGPALHPPSRSPRAAAALPLGPPLSPVTLPVHAIYAATHTGHNGEAVFALGLWGRARGILAAAASSSGVPASYSLSTPPAPQLDAAALEEH